RHRGGPLSVDPVLRELAPERGAADPERLGGTRVITTEALQRLEDVSALGLREADLAGQRRRRAKLKSRGYVRRKVLGLHRVAPRQDRGALDRVLQLAHVSRPRGAGQAFEGRRRQAKPAARRAGCAREEMLGQRWNVLSAITERREH